MELAESYIGLVMRNFYFDYMICLVLSLLAWYNDMMKLVEWY